VCPSRLPPPALWGAFLFVLAGIPAARAGDPPDSSSHPVPAVLDSAAVDTSLWWPAVPPRSRWFPVAALLLPTDELLVAEKAQNRLYLIPKRKGLPVRLPEPSPTPVEWTALSGAPGLALYALDGPGGKIQQFDFQGNYLGLALDLESLPTTLNLGRVDAYGLAVDRSGRAVVTDRQNDRVLLFGPGWSFLGVSGETGSAPGAWRRPGCAAASEHGLFLIVDEGNRRVVLLDAVGSVKAVHETKEVPRGVSYLGSDRFAVSLASRVEVLNVQLDLEHAYPVPPGPSCGSASYATAALTGTRDRILVGEGCSGRLLELRIRGD
jgi:hypothetical protein